MIATINKVVNGVVILSVVFGLLFWAYSSKIFERNLSSGGSASLIFWGLEDESVMQPVIDAYTKDNPQVRITYVQQSIINYRTRLQTQLKEGKGPDIFDIHNSWFPMFSGYLSVMPSDLMSQNDFLQTFYPVAGDSLTSGGKIYAIPREVDGLALYYNDDILKSANVQVPTTWAQFRDAARQVTVKDQQGQIVTSGAALGTTNNVDFWPEIITLLFYQEPDGDLKNPDNDAGKEVFKFYTSFVTDTQNQTWNSLEPSSTKMFVDGKLAFYFAPAREAPEIRQANPNLVFRTAPVPQLPGKEISLGTFWAEAVSAYSPSQAQAWRFLKYLSGKEALQILYRHQVAAEGIGEPFPRVDMAELQTKDPILGAFITQGNYYKSWYLNSDTEDVGINQDMIQAYQPAVDNADNGGYSTTIDQAVQTVIDKYWPRTVK